jgi:hypothetical protein
MANGHEKIYCSFTHIYSQNVHFRLRVYIIKYGNSFVIKFICIFSVFAHLQKKHLKIRLK